MDWTASYNYSAGELRNEKQLCMVLLALAMSLNGSAQNDPNRLNAALQELNNQWWTAFNQGDGAAMDRLEVPDLILVNFDGKGRIWRKNGPRAGHQKPNGATAKLSDATIRQFGDAAILTGIVTMKVLGSQGRKMSTQPIPG